MKCSRAVLLVPSLVLALGAAPRERVWLSVPGIELQKGERIWRFSVDVKGGTITALPRVPQPWKLKLTNAEDDRAELDAKALSGYGAIRPEFFAEFLELELLGDASVRVTIELTEDWSKTSRTLVFKDDQLARSSTDRRGTRP